MIFNFSVVSPIFNLNKQKQAASRECPNLCLVMLGNAPKGSWRPVEQNIKAIGDSLGNAQRGL
jgi:hypothetical protein